MNGGGKKGALSPSHTGQLLYVFCLAILVRGAMILGMSGQFFVCCPW